MANYSDKNRKITDLNSYPENDDYKVKYKRKFNLADFIALMLVLVIVVLLGRMAYQYISYNLLNFVTPDPGSLEERLSSQAIVMRHEYILEAPANGVFEPMVQERRRVVAGAVIGYLIDGQGNRTAVKAAQAGLVIYATDGGEEMLSLSNLTELDMVKLFGLFPLDSPGKFDHSSLSKGQPVGKIVDNLLDYTVLFALDHTDKEVPEQGNISFYPQDSTASIKGKIQDSLESGSLTYLIVTVSSKESFLIDSRFFEAEIVGVKLEGSILPDTAIWTNEEGVEGVFYRNNNRVGFKAVEVKGSVDGQVAVEGLNFWDQVISNPQEAKLGQKLF